MNKEIYVNIKISMPNGSDMSFSDEEIKEIQDYYEKEFSNFDYLVGEINVSFVDEKTKQIDQLKQQLDELEQEFAELKEKYNKTNEKLKNITEEIDNNFVHGQDYEKLKQELSELKQKAIVPRFEYGDKVYYIKYFVGKWQVFNQEYVGENISNIIVRTMNYYSELPKDSVFATEQEAQAKLKEIQGNE